MLLRWLPAIAILLGLATSSGDSLTWLVQPCLMTMMVAAFVRTRALRGWRPSRFLGSLLIFQVGGGAAMFVILSRWSEVAGVTGLLLALTPTAVSATAVATGAGADVRLVTSTIAAGSIVSCFTLPVVSFLAPGSAFSGAAIMEPARLIATTVLVPYLVAVLLLRVSPHAREWFGGRIWRVSVRFLWSTILWVAASKVANWYVLDPESTFLQNAWPFVLGGLTFVFFAAFGWFGHRFTRRFTPRAQRLESMICHAHKNTGLALLIILHSLPLSMAAAVLSYTLMQNAFFSLLPDRKDLPHQNSAA
jgi:predicted Na+-dependent transporter